MEDDAAWQPCAIFFDYDDTLLPTEALCGASDEAPTLAQLHVEVARQMAEVDQAVQALLRHAVRLCGRGGRVAIVTSAARRWINQTLELLLPAAAGAIKELGIPIVASGERGNGSSSGAWHKVLAFQELLGELPGHVRQVVSVGDGLPERVALHFLATQVGPMLQCSCGQEASAAPACKSLQTRNMPRIPSLLEQLRFLRRSALEHLVRASTGVGRGEEHAAADLHVDPVKPLICMFSQKERTTLWGLVDAMGDEKDAVCCAEAATSAATCSGTPEDMFAGIMQVLRSRSPLSMCRGRPDLPMTHNQIVGQRAPVQRRHLGSMVKMKSVFRDPDDEVPVDSISALPHFVYSQTPARAAACPLGVDSPASPQKPATPFAAKAAATAGGGSAQDPAGFSKGPVAPCVVLVPATGAPGPAQDNRFCEPL